MSERKVPDWIDGFMDYTDHSEPPASFKLWTAISVLSSVLQRKCRLDWGSLTFYPNMYVVLVAPSGKARKGTAMGFGSDFLEDLPVKLAAESITREALIGELKNATDSIQLSPTEIEMHSSLTIFAPELTVFLGYNNHALMSDLTDWYDCRSRWIYRTKHMGVDEINGVYVSLFGATTPELVRTTLPLDAIGGGLTSRMIFVYEPNKGKTVPDPFQSDADLRLKQLLKIDLERISMLKGVFKVTQSFVERWTEWYLEIEDNPPFNDHRFSGYIERRPNHVMKLCMLVNASRSDKMIITREDLERSINILEFTEKKMVNTFSGVGKAINADITTRVMQEIAIKKTVNFTDLLRDFYFDADVRTMEGIITTLRSMKFITTSGMKKEMVITYAREEDESDSLQTEPDRVGGASPSHQEPEALRSSGAAVEDSFGTE